MAQAYMVWNEDAQEGVIFDDYKDAQYAATGKAQGLGVSTIADAWRDTYGEDGEQYAIKAVEI